MGREARAHAGVIDPTMAKTIDVSKVSRGQLAQLMNDQAKAIGALQQQVAVCSRILCALALEPQAFIPTAGHVAVDADAVKRVVNGTDLSVSEEHGMVVLTATHPTSVTPALEQP